MLNLVLSLSFSHTGHWKFNMAPHGKELSDDLKQIIVALHKDGVGYKKIAKTLKLSCSTVVAKTIQRFNRTGSTQNRPRHGRPKKLNARAQHHIQRLCLGNRHMCAASIAAEVEGVGDQPVWGCISTADMYCDILKQSMIPSLRRLGCRAVLQHDNDDYLAKEYEGKVEVCTGSKLKPKPGPYPRSSDPTRPDPDPSGTVKFKARTRPEI